MSENNNLQIKVHELSDVKVDFAMPANKKVVRDQGVFLLYDGDTVVYIGKSLDVQSTVVGHYKSKTFDSWNFIKCPDERQEELLEDLVLAYRPIHNKFLVSNTQWVSKTRAKNKFGVHKSKFDKMVRSGLFSKVAYFEDVYVLKEELLSHGFQEV